MILKTRWFPRNANRIREHAELDRVVEIQDFISPRQRKMWPGASASRGSQALCTGLVKDLSPGDYLFNSTSSAAISEEALTCHTRLGV